MRSTLDAERLIEAIKECMDADREEREARERHDGPSWGYWGSEYFNREAKAAAQFEDELERAIVRVLVKYRLIADRSDDI